MSFLTKLQAQVAQYYYLYKYAFSFHTLPTTTAEQRQYNTFCNSLDNTRWINRQIQVRKYKAKSSNNYK